MFKVGKMKLAILLIATCSLLVTKHVVLGEIGVVTEVIDAVKSFGKCLNTEETHDKWLGKLALKPELYCTAATLRNVPGVTCCTPQNTTDFDLKFWLYKPGQKDYEEVAFYDPKVKDKIADSKKDLVFLITGFLETVANSPWLNKTRDGFLARGHPVVSVDWGKAAQLQYWQASATLRTVGAAVGYAIIKWDIIDKVLVSGLSLGGQTVGEVGKYVRQKSGKLVKECHAMDPAGPFFDGGHKDMILDKGDCKVVQVIHTSASQSKSTGIVEMLLLRLGTSAKSGHCDFWINCGRFQEKDCLSPSLTSVLKAVGSLVAKQSDGKTVGFAAETAFCSHVRSAILYSNAVNNKCKNQSYKCKNCGNGLSGDICGADGPVVNSLPPDSNCDPSQDVNYYMKTQASGNYCSVKA